MFGGSVVATLSCNAPLVHLYRCLVHVLLRSTSVHVVLAEVLGGAGVGIASMSTLLVKPGVSRALGSDEFEEVFDEAAIGIELEDVSEASTADSRAPTYDTYYSFETSRNLSTLAFRKTSDARHAKKMHQCNGIHRCNGSWRRWCRCISDSEDDDDRVRW